MTIAEPVVADKPDLLVGVEATDSVWARTGDRLPAPGLARRPAGDHRGPRQRELVQKLCVGLGEADRDRRRLVLDLDSFREIAILALSGGAVRRAYDPLVRKGNGRVDGEQALEAGAEVGRYGVPSE